MPSDSRTARFAPGRTAGANRACGDAWRRMWSCLHGIELRLGTASLSIPMEHYTAHARGPQEHLWLVASSRALHRPCYSAAQGMASHSVFVGWLS